jgi:hypothetical protein
LTGSGRSQTTGVWRHVLAKRPSPAMVVALIALFVAMGGTGYAVTKLPKRSVGSIQLKKGAVRKENIAKGAVTVSKLANGLVGDAPAGSSGPAPPIIVNQDIPSDAVAYASKAGWADNADKADRATLADKANSATTATSATSAGSATTAGSAANADALGGHDSSYFLPRSTILDLPQFWLTPGQTRAIQVPGPFTYTATCAVDVAEILIATSASHSAFDGEVITPDLLTSSPVGSRVYAHIASAAPGLPAFRAENDGTAVAPNGAEVRETVWYVGVNIFNQPGRCYFGGYAIV